MWFTNPNEIASTLIDVNKKKKWPWEYKERNRDKYFKDINRIGIIKKYFISQNTLFVCEVD